MASENSKNLVFQYYSALLEYDWPIVEKLALDIIVNAQDVLSKESTVAAKVYSGLAMSQQQNGNLSKATVDSAIKAMEVTFSIPREKLREKKNPDWSVYFDMALTAVMTYAGKISGEDQRATIMQIEPWVTKACEMWPESDNYENSFSRASQIIKSVLR